MKQTIMVTLVTTTLLAGLFFLGGYYLLAGLGAVGLTTIIFLAFGLGAQWCRKLMTDGARLAIEAASRNDDHDARKIAALAKLTGEAIRIKTEAPANNSYPLVTGYPALPPTTTDGAFTIAGFDDNE